jgi:hypothetical protein
MHLSGYSQRMTTLVGSIRALAPNFRSLSDRFPKETGDATELEAWSSDVWRVHAFRNALIKLRILVEQNFSYIETLGLLSVCRYIFELSVWLRLLSMDRRYGLMFGRELLDTQLRFYTDTVKHYKREVDFLRSMDKREDALVDEKMASHIKRGDWAEAARAQDRAGAEIDAIAARAFSVFSDDARHNGYGYQAHLVETQSILQIEGYISDIASRADRLKERLAVEASDLPKIWKWRPMAELAGVAHEHDYIYAYASKLIHATPASVLTDQKNLEPQEMYIFLRYIHTKLHDAIDLAEKVALQPTS